MKKTLIISCASLVLLASACNSNTGSKANGTGDSAKEVTAPADTSSSLSDLKSSAGKYPKEISLFENTKLKPRLQKLLGADYDTFVKYWNTETPITVENEVMSTSGCEQHNCADNRYLLLVDFANDNINVFHFSKGKVEKNYAEKGEIKLPNGLQKNFESLQSK